MPPFPYKIIDLSHTLDETAPSWSGGCGFRQELKGDYQTLEAPPVQTLEEVVAAGHTVSFRVQQLKMHAGIGTHLDAPAHCIPGGMSVEQLPLADLISPCVVIDLSSKSHQDYQVSVEDIKEFEGKHGKISSGSFVIFHTGWEKFWTQAELYRNNHRFPSVSAEAALFLLEREIGGIGVDTLSPDTPANGYPVHAALLGAGKYIVENVAHAASLPPTGSFALALPLKIKGATEAPLRLIALVSVMKVGQESFCEKG